MAIVYDAKTRLYHIKGNIRMKMVSGKTTNVLQARKALKEKRKLKRQMKNLERRWIKVFLINLILSSL